MASDLWLLTKGIKWHDSCTICLECVKHTKDAEFHSARAILPLFLKRLPGKINRLDTLWKVVGVSMKFPKIGLVCCYRLELRMTCPV